MPGHGEVVVPEPGPAPVEHVQLVLWQLHTLGPEVDIFIFSKPSHTLGPEVDI